MIAYQLNCENDHGFESWFKSSEDFDKLNDRALINCPDCGSSNIRKRMMAPNVTPARRAGKNPNNLLAAMRKELKSAKNVGWQFANEARAIHYGDKEPVRIYGKSEPEDIKSLLDEGIGVLPLPFDPEVKEN